jgi:hypothetical protein
MLCFEAGLLVAGRCPGVPNQGSVLLLLFKEGKKVAHIASELGIGRGSVYRALECAGQVRRSLS